jgi:CcmD family protein
MRLPNWKLTPRGAEMRHEDRQGREATSQWGGSKLKNMNSLMAAYLAVWAIFFVYHFTVSRRLARLQDEVKRLKDTRKP